MKYDDSCWQSKRKDSSDQTHQIKQFNRKPLTVLFNSLEGKHKVILLKSYFQKGGRKQYGIFSASSFRVDSFK